jgi:RNA polymerase sigma-70 factor, ECF subfamily
MTLSAAEVTQLLSDWNNGDREAFDRLMPLVYDELRRMARRYMARESPDHTLQTTALINEAYLKLVGQQEKHWQNRAHFFGFAAQAMRHILVDHARAHRQVERGGGAPEVPLDEAMTISSERAAELVALDDALKDLARLDARKSQIVELRYFAGLSIEETGDLLNISPVTVRRDWALAKGWLYREMSQR